MMEDEGSQDVRLDPFVNFRFNFFARRLNWSTGNEREFLSRSHSFVDFRNQVAAECRHF